MAAATYDSILKEIATKNLRPVYYLMGDEPYYIDELAAHFATDILTESEREFNQTIVYAQDTTLDAILSLAKRYPMMADRQVIIVREAQQFKGDIDQLGFYLQKPQLSTVLVFCHKGGTLDRRKKATADIERAGGAIYESRRLKDDLLPYFIRDDAGKHQFLIDEKATMMLVEGIGSDLGRLTSELSKLYINMTEGQNTITPDMVEAYTGISKEYNVFELKNALMNRDAFAALRIANYMDANPKAFPLQQVLPLLFSTFANLMLAYYVPQRTPAGVASYLGMKSTWAVGDLMYGMNHYTASKVLEIIGAFRRYDALSKGVGATANTTHGLLRELVCYILE